MNTYNLKNNEAEKWREAIALAQTGWWEADPDHQVYFCSDFIADLLSLLSKEISFSYLFNTIREDYHDPVSSNFLPENKKEKRELSNTSIAPAGTIRIYCKWGQEQTDEKRTVDVYKTDKYVTLNASTAFAFDKTGS